MGAVTQKQKQTEGGRDMFCLPDAPDECSAAVVYGI